MLHVCHACALVKATSLSFSMSPGTKLSMGSKHTFHLSSNPGIEIPYTFNIRRLLVFHDIIISPNTATKLSFSSLAQQKHVQDHFSGIVGNINELQLQAEYVTVCDRT